MKKIVRIPLIIIVSFIWLILGMFFYSTIYPKEAIIISKKHQKGFAFKNHRLEGYVYPRHSITLINAFRSRTISLRPDVWDSVNKWDIYKAKHPL